VRLKVDISLMLDFPVGGAPARDGGRHVDARLKDARPRSMGEAREVPYGADPEERRARTVRSLPLTTPTTGKESMTELNTAAGRESARTPCDGRACRSAWPRKWWHAILYWILDAAYVLYTNTIPRPAIARVAFPYDIIDALAASANAVSYAPSPPVPTPSARALADCFLLWQPLTHCTTLPLRLMDVATSAERRGARLARWTSLSILYCKRSKRSVAEELPNHRPHASRALLARRKRGSRQPLPLRLCVCVYVSVTATLSPTSRVLLWAIACRSHPLCREQAGWISHITSPPPSTQRCQCAAESRE